MSRTNITGTPVARAASTRACAFDSAACGAVMSAPRRAISPSGAPKSTWQSMISTAVRLGTLLVRDYIHHAIGAEGLAQFRRQRACAMRGIAGLCLVAPADETAIRLAHREFKAALRHAGANQKRRLQRFRLANAIAEIE